MKVLASAFGCAPCLGSEDGRGWNVVTRLSAFHDVWVITRSLRRLAIQDYLRTHPNPRLHLVYYDIPWLGRLVDWLSASSLLRPYVSNLYYYLWQVFVYPLVLRLHRRIHFDLTHHVSYVRYWMPSPLAFLPVPFVWGTVGGADLLPLKLLSTLPMRGLFFEVIRGLTIRLAEFDPLVRLTARRSAAALAMTPATLARLKVLGAPNVLQVIDSGLGMEDELSIFEDCPELDTHPLRFISVGRLIHWKGYHLALQAFAHLSDLESEYWLFGQGPERARLETLCRRLNIQARVRFYGHVPREQVLQSYARSHIFVHPSLHDSGGWVVLEAMAARRPVICLDLGGPSTLVTPQTGIKIPVYTPPQVIADLAAAMHHLALDPGWRRKMGQNGRRRVEELFTWNAHVEQVLAVYDSVRQAQNGPRPGYLPD